jgi:tail tube protein
MAFNTSTYFGTDGSISLSDVDGFGGFAGYFGESGAVGRVTNISIRIATELKTFHELGSRAPRELRAGNFSISGSVERAYINGAMLKMMLGDYAEKEEAPGFKIPTFNMKIILDNATTPGDPGNSTLTVFGAIFDSWTFHLPEDDFVLENLTFQAKRLSITDTEMPS